MNLRKILLLVAVLFATSALVVAQQHTMTIVDVPVEDANDLDARAYFPKRDMNDEVCALLKVATTNLLGNKLILEVGGLGVVDRVEQENGEIWFYLPARVKNLRFSCAGYSTPPAIPVNFKPATVYRLTIRTDAVFQTVQNAVLSAAFLKIVVNTEGAVVSLGRTTEYEMVNRNISGKLFSERLNYGTYYYKVEHPLCETVTGIVEVKAGLADLHINLQPAYGYLTITSSPSGAELFIDGKSVGTTPWSGDERFGKGGVEVRIRAENYYPLRESVTIAGRGERESRHFDLRPQFGTVECVCDDAEAELWIDEEHKGKGRWTGTLGSLSQHILEARRAGHQSQSVAIVVNEGGNTTCRVGAPVAMWGALEVQTTTPEMCNIAIDGQAMGTTPTILSLLVGKHKVDLSAEGYQTDSFEVEIAHNQTNALTRGLKAIPAPNPISAPAPAVARTLASAPTPAPTPATTLADTPAPIVTKTYKVGDLYDDGTKRGVVFEASADGVRGKIVSLVQPDEQLAWSEAKEWCAAQGASWYLPSKNDLTALCEVKDEVNNALTTNGFQELVNHWYWSGSGGTHDVRIVLMYNGNTHSSDKYNTYYVCAVSNFNQTYKVGDLYDDGTKRGIVFEVTDGGLHGKIVLLEAPEETLDWFDAKEWCATQGTGWHLPSKKELITLYKVRQEVDKTLIANGFEALTNHWYWSSMGSGDKAVILLMGNGNTNDLNMNVSLYVRAVSDF